MGRKLARRLTALENKTEEIFVKINFHPSLKLGTRSATCTKALQLFGSKPGEDHTTELTALPGCLLDAMDHRVVSHIDPKLITTELPQAVKHFVAESADSGSNTAGFPHSDLRNDRQLSIRRLDLRHLDLGRLDLRRPTPSQDPSPEPRNPVL